MSISRDVMSRDTISRDTISRDTISRDKLPLINAQYTIQTSVLMQDGALHCHMSHFNAETSRSTVTVVVLVHSIWGYVVECTCTVM